MKILTITKGNTKAGDEPIITETYLNVDWFEITHQRGNGDWLHVYYENGDDLMIGIDLKIEKIIVVK